MTKFAAVLLTALLIGAGATAPAQSQSIGFGMFFGDEPSDFYDERPGFFNEPILCMTDSQIRRAIENEGYSNVALNVPNDRRVQVRASRNGTVYLLKFNYCTGVIEESRVLRRAN